MANEKNLIPFDKRTEKEQREIRSKGGKASQKKQAEQKRIREAMQEIMSMQINHSEIRSFLGSLGIPDEKKTWAYAEAAMTAKNALKYPAFARLLYEMLGENEVQGVSKIPGALNIQFSDKPEDFK